MQPLRPRSKAVFFTVHTDPVAKGRPRFSTQSGFPRAYTPKKTTDAELLIALCAKQHFPTPLDGPLRVGMKFYMPIPKYRMRKKEVQFHTKRPDLDNLCKTILDSLNGIAYHDDSQIIALDAMKGYSGKPRVEIFVAEIDTEVDSL